MPDKSSALYLAAIHEAGHVVLAELFNIIVNYAEVFDKENGFGGSSISFPQKDYVLNQNVGKYLNCNSDEKDAIESESKICILILLAGPCAESISQKNDPTTISIFGDDTEKIENLINFRLSLGFKTDIHELMTVTKSFLQDCFITLENIAESILEADNHFLDNDDINNILSADIEYSDRKNRMWSNPAQ